MSNHIASATSQIAVQALNLLSARDFDGLRAILSPNVRLDWPYHYSGSPVVIEGADAFMDAVRVIKVFQELEIVLVDVNELNQTGTTIIEARSRGTYSTDRPNYTNHYIFVLTVVDGKVTVWREFYNPLEVIKANAKPEKKAPINAS